MSGEVKRYMWNTAGMAQMYEYQIGMPDTNPMQSYVPATDHDALEQENARLRQTVTRLNRRCTNAEPWVTKTIEDCKREGVSLGRKLSAAGYYMELHKREQAEAKLEQAKTPCVWTEDIEADEWYSACGDAFGLDGNTPKEQGIKYCPNCGHRVEVADQPDKEERDE